MRRLLALAAVTSLVAACTSVTPPTEERRSASGPQLHPKTGLPIQTVPTPAQQDRPAFGTPEFNLLKDAPPDVPADVAHVPDAVPQDEPRARSGNRSPYTVLGKVYEIAPTSRGFTQTGRASWYGKKFHGNKTASGERYDMYTMTAAHRNLPLPTYIRVTNQANGREVIVKVNDRGPFHGDRVLDLSYAAAAKLGMLQSGTAMVTIEALDPAEFQRELASNGRPTGPARPAENSNAQYFVQVGAFGALNNATALQSRLLGLVYAPVIIARGEEPNPVHRVQVGPFVSRADAEKISQVIKEGALGDPRIVSR